MNLHKNCFLNSNDVDLDTLGALESYLEEYEGVLVVVSHDRFFTDKVCDHLFVFEGNGVVKDYLGSLSEYAMVLYEEKNDMTESTWSSDNSDNGSGFQENKNKSLSYKEEKQKRIGRQNELKKLKREMSSLDKKIDTLRIKAESIQKEIDDSSDEGWSFLADLTAKLDEVNTDLDEKELRWMEIAEILEEEDSN